MGDIISRTPDRYAPGELDWIEKAAFENLKGRVATADVLAKEAATTLTVLLAGAGAGWAYALKLFDQTISSGDVGALVAAIWLTFLGMLLVIRCLKIGEIPAVYNQPGQLLLRYKFDESFDEWRRGELENVEERISKAVKRNNEMARRLNLVRMLAVATPILSGIGILLFIAVR